MANKLPFLFIHGAGGTQSKWRLLREKLGDIPAQYVDLPGRGNNLDVSANSIGAYANKVSDMIHEETIVVGHSMGGLIGIQLASTNPKVKGLVLVGSHFTLPVHPKILNKLNEGTFPDGLFYASYSKGVSTVLLEEEKAEIGNVPISVTHNDFYACNEYMEGKKNLIKAAVPILAVYGEDDRMLPLNASSEIMSLNSNTTVTTVTNSGHYIMIEQPEALADILIEFRNNLN